MFKTEKVVATLVNADALAYYLNNDLEPPYEYKGWQASRSAKVLETLADEGKFIVVVEQLTIEYIESRNPVLIRKSGRFSGRNLGPFQIFGRFLVKYEYQYLGILIDL